MNLYGFVRNNPISLWDILGMEPSERATRGGSTTVFEEISPGVWGYVSYRAVPSGMGGGDDDDPHEWAQYGKPIIVGNETHRAIDIAATLGETYGIDVSSLSTTGDSQFRAALRAFLTGSTQVTYTFGEGDPWTVDMRNHPHVVGVVRQVSALLGDAGSAEDLIGVTTSANYNLNSQPLMNNLLTYVRDGLAGIGLTSAVHATGSFRLSYTVTEIVNGVAIVNFQISDTLSFGSATRLPMTNLSIVNLIAAGAMADQGGAGSALQQTLLTAPASSVNNPMGPHAPLNNINLQWNWTQTFYVGPPPTDRPGG